MGLDLRISQLARVELIRQTELAECGLASLAMVANFHGMKIDLALLRGRFPPSMRGATLRSLITIADEVGLSSRAIKLALEDIPNLAMPAILHWNMCHFVVIERVRGGRALIHDPAGHTSWVPMDVVSQNFSGVALELSPSADFEKIDARARLRLRQLWTSVSGFKRSILQILVLSLVMQGYILIAPYYLQLAIDAAAPTDDHALLFGLAIAFTFFAIMNALTSLLRSFVVLATGTQIGTALAVNIARRLLRLPVSWFEHRQVGDILSRFQSITPIQQAMSLSPVSAALDGILVVGTFVMMTVYSVKLALLSLAALALFVAVKSFLFRMQRRSQEAVIVTGAKAQTTLIESVRGISTLRMFGREGARLAVWQAAFVDSMNATFRFTRVTAWQDFTNLAVFGIEGVLSTWLAISLVMTGQFTLGMVFAFFAFKAQFVAKSVSCFDQILQFRMLSLHLDRLSDIALNEEDRGFRDAGSRTTELRGKIELRDLSFRYSASDPVVLDGINFIVQPGEHVAITGPSGGGKSTLAKILLGLLDHEGGLVLVDDLPLTLFGLRNYQGQVGAVLQDDHLFAGTIADNIALFDEHPDGDDIARSAQAAAIHEDILRMPMGYETLIGDMGSTLSGGQKQRVLLARALYRRPKLVVIDEGTSHLDPEHERRVNKSISALGVTRIVIAHRAETIAAADRVMILDGGKMTMGSSQNHRGN